jgi:RNA polymerase sigma-70 factor (ECF subfamily)
MTDQELMSAVSAGDGEAAEELVLRYRKRLFKYLLGWVKSPEEALDLTQEALFKVCGKAHLYNGSAPASAWIFKVARNLVIDRSRGKEYQVVSAAVPLEGVERAGRLGSVAGPERWTLRKEITNRVKKAIEELPPRQKEVVQLRLLADLKLEEIADTMGLSLGGVKSTLHNALKSLRVALADLKEEHYVNL